MSDHVSVMDRKTVSAFQAKKSREVSFVVIEPVQGRSETSVPPNLEVQQDTIVRLMHIQIHYKTAPFTGWFQFGIIGFGGATAQHRWHRRRYLRFINRSCRQYNPMTKEAPNRQMIILGTESLSSTEIFAIGNGDYCINRRSKRGESWSSSKQFVSSETDRTHNY
uniref:Uncharacterized protein n=3 Tax=Oryza TaxID=4527 RepID=A0A0D3H7S4_9ORYZ